MTAISQSLADMSIETSAAARTGQPAPDLIVSTFDGTANNVAISSFLGHGYIMFIGPDGEDWNTVTRRIQRLNKGLPSLQIVQLRYDNSSPFAQRYGVTDGGFVFISPDGTIEEIMVDPPWGPFRESIVAGVLKRVWGLDDLETGNTGLPPMMAAAVRADQM